MEKIEIAGKAIDFFIEVVKVNIVVARQAGLED